MNKKIIVIGDDFGFSKNINRAFVECYKFSILQECSLMVDAFASREAVHLARQNTIKDIGIHFSLFHHSRGDSYPRASDYDRILSEVGQNDLIQMLKEELDMFIALVGQPPTHITGHQSLHLHPKVIDFVFQYASLHKIYVRIREQSPTKRSWVEHDLVDQKLKQYTIIRADKTVAFIFGDDAEDRYITEVKNTRDGSIIELFMHPGYVGDFEKQYTSLIIERKQDRNLLISKSFKDKLGQIGRLIHCRQIEQYEYL